MEIIFGILVGLLALTFLVALHELGHAYAAIKNGVVVEEYGIGFPPAAYKFEKKTDWILPKGTVISINWLPLGGFVKLQGEHDSDSGEGDYGAASFWGKTQILLAGVAMNWAISAVIFTVLAWVGMPQLVANQFRLASDSRVEGGEVLVVGFSDDSAAQKAGIEEYDQIAKVDGVEIVDWDDVSDALDGKIGQNVEVVVIRNGEEISKKVTVGEKDGRGILGVGLAENGREIYATWSAPIVGVGTTAQLTLETFKGVGEMAGDFFGGLAQKFSFDEQSRNEANVKIEKASEGVAGPISIMGVLFPNAVSRGVKTILLLIAVISLSLACMNVLPIPALDGGRWLSTFIFRIILKKPLSAETEEKINTAGFLAIMALSLLVIVADVFKVF